jgi:hypothetical protein
MVGRSRWPRGRLGGQIWELEPMATGSQLGAPRERRSAPLWYFAGVCGGLWRCLVGGRFGAVVFISRGAADAGGAC